jgi:hypothetical protein
MTAAEILAAEQAAAALAAEQAAALATQQAAANTLTATASNAATNQSILNAIGAGGGTPATAAQLGGYGGINSIGAAGTGAGTGTGIMGAQTLTPATAAQTLTPAAEVANLSNVPLETLDPAQLEQVNQLATGAENLARNAPVTEVTAYTGQGSMMNPPPAEVAGSQNPLYQNLNQNARSMDLGGAGGLEQGGGTGISRTLTPDQLAGPNQYSMSQGLNYSSPLSSSTAPASATPQSGFMKGIGDALDWMDKNPFKTAIGAYGVAQKLGLFDPEDQPEKKPYDGILSKYKMSSDFKGRQANPQDYQYTPKTYGMASGGIASYRQGGDLSKQLDYYEQMMRTKAPAAERGDPGIYYDLDPDTRYQDAVTAAQIRQAKVNKRANLQLPGMKRPTPMGQLNMVPVTMKASPNAPDTTEAAQGGVMSLGGYAAGGNPRLLKGPGDGMSDNIPATIAGKRPARLADGEFVVPADVVSHLGNGSTEAGAKKLHKMMDDVRKARTGNPKQGKQINPNKFMPK